MKSNSIAVLADSCNDIPQELLEKYQIYTLPLMINYKDASYRDRVDITPEQVYERFQEEIPKTSLPLPETIVETFAKIKADGFDQVIVSAISSGLSGTYQTIKLLAEDIPDMRIAVIDTLNIAIASGFVALYAAEQIEAGLPFDEVVTKTQAAVKKSTILFGVGTLEYLMKGGRIGKVSGILGSALNIKPIISCNEDGIYYTVAKVRGRKQSIQKLIDMTREKLGQHKNYYLSICHGDDYEEMLLMKEQLKDLVAGAKIYAEGQISPVLGVHTGPGLLGVGIMVLED
ncbi:DegV family protein [Trichococcus shcherbakoviae]|uniref:DegV family protein n=1 Tax=Trichococcus shcherbakoviae subsp. psychrophilus TaxID=2585775 RepID=A0A5C5E9D2_9LACT|nr:DegV family protein [Trichococcus shcherbakoviae]MBP8683169.1 DegV family protein [Trichococcus sp.]OUL07847.1 fatty acid-binding protein DegV [Sedimentibacter sp. SX930]MBP9976918.1 DegV family protein [Trichococcus sp.]TNV68007.1 DegV family protein [Trichococcus shcherbakoviae subsp. psychrophilus]TNV69662.1 DegV family protein [Trichococcus shcherbakoviae subsp. psychrophilus]